MTITIRPLEEEDRSMFIAMIQAMHGESKYKAIPFEDDKINWAVDDVLQNDSMTCYVAEKEGSLLGFIAMQIMTYYFNRGTYATDQSFYVYPSWRMTSVPMRLIRAAELWAEINRCGAIVLGVTAPESLEKVEKFYTKIGYQKWGSIVRKEF